MTEPDRRYYQAVVVGRDPDSGSKFYTFGWAEAAVDEYVRDCYPEYTTTVWWVSAPRRAYSEPTAEDFDAEPGALPGGAPLLGGAQT